MIDLYLNGDMGLWALENIPKANIFQVFSSDMKIIERTESMGIVLKTEDPNKLNFQSSSYGISIHYPKILKPHVINKYLKIYNLHPSFLPFGRGYYPIFWALWENTPAGATLHEINEKIDQGNIVAQLQVNYDEVDTGESLFYRVREAERKLLLEYWEKIAKGEELISFSQQHKGTYHTKREFMELKQNYNWKKLTSEELVKLVRCLTFEGYSGLEIMLGKKNFAIKLQSLD